MMILKKINPRIPNVLVAVAVTTVISLATGFNNDAFVDVNKVQPRLKPSVKIVPPL